MSHVPVDHAIRVETLILLSVTEELDGFHAFDGAWISSKGATYKSTALWLQLVPVSRLRRAHPLCQLRNFNDGGRTYVLEHFPLLHLDRLLNWRCKGLF